jgi:hypothetical protein
MLDNSLTKIDLFMILVISEKLPTTPTLRIIGTCACAEEAH